MDNSPDSRENNIYSPGSDKLTEVQVYIATKKPVSRAVSDVEMPFFLILAVKAAKS